MAVGVAVLSDGSSTVNINHPLFGYKTSIDMALKIKRKANGHLSSYDATSTYDIRTFSGTVQMLDDYSLIEDMIRLTAAGRAKSLTLTLGTNSGFFPFGPDLGDVGVFTMACLPPVYEGVGESPFRYYTTQFTWVLISGPVPAYTITADGNYDYGNLTIGSIANLKFPDGWARPENPIQYAVSTTNNPANIKYTDFGQDGDIWDTAMTLNCGQIKAANLINHLTGTVRGASVNVIPPTGGFIFGVSKASTATYACHLLNKRIEITHNNYNDFDIDLAFNAD